jgi:hypothetical protein
VATNIEQLNTDIQKELGLDILLKSLFSQVTQPRFSMEKFIHEKPLTQILTRIIIYPIRKIRHRAEMPFYLILKILVKIIFR